MIRKRPSVITIAIIKFMKREILVEKRSKLSGRKNGFIISTISLKIKIVIVFIIKSYFITFAKLLIILSIKRFRKIKERAQVINRIRNEIF